MNMMGSTLVRSVDVPILQGRGTRKVRHQHQDGPEPGGHLAARLDGAGPAHGALERAGSRASLREEVASLSDLVLDTLNERSGYFHTLRRTTHQHMKNWLYLGRGIYYPAALECALKMKEVTYLHAEGMSAGFLKHGTISLIDENMYTIVLMPTPEEAELHALTRSSAEEVRARGGFVLGYRFEGDEVVEGPVQRGDRVAQGLPPARALPAHGLRASCWPISSRWRSSATSTGRARWRSPSPSPEGALSPDAEREVSGERTGSADSPQVRITPRLLG